MTKQECDQAYTFEANQIGHKLYIIRKLDAEIEAHFDKCQELDEQKALLLEEEKKQNDSISNLPADRPNSTPPK